MAAIATPPPSIAPENIPAPPTPNAEPVLNGPPRGSAGLESRLSAALSSNVAPPTPPSPSPASPQVPLVVQPPVVQVDGQPLDPNAAPAPAPAEPPAEEVPSLEEFDFDNPPEGDATPAPPDPLAEVRETLGKEGELTREESDRVRGAFLKTEHGRRMYAADQVRRELEKAPTEGGLGRMPTIEEIKQGEMDRLAMAEMVSDFDQNPLNWAANFFGHQDPTTGQLVMRPGVENMMDVLPEHLAKVSPELHARLAGNAAAPYFAKVASDIAAMPQRTAEEAQAKVMAGRGLNMIEQYLLGRITRIPGFQYEDGQGAPNGQPQNQQIDPERQRFLAEKAAFQQQQQQAQRAAQQAAHSSILQEQTSALLGDAKAILRSAGLHKVSSQMVFDQMAQVFVNQVQSKIEGDSRNAIHPHNPAGLKNYQIQLRNAVAGQLDKSQPIGSYRRMAHEVMRREAPSFTQNAVGNAEHQIASQHAAAGAAAGRREATPGASPQGAPPPVQQSSARPKGMDPEEFFRQRIGNALSAGQPQRA